MRYSLHCLTMCHLGFGSQGTILLREYDLVLELRGEAFIRDGQLLPLFHKLRHLLVQIWAQLLLQTGELHPQRLFACTDGWMLELSNNCQQCSIFVCLVALNETYASGRSASPSMNSCSVIFGLTVNGLAMLPDPQTGQSSFF